MTARTCTPENGPPLRGPRFDRNVQCKPASRLSKHLPTNPLLWPPPDVLRKTALPIRKARRGGLWRACPQPDARGCFGFRGAERRPGEFWTP